MFNLNYVIKNVDINYGGHVGNERALLFFQFARIEFFKSLGLKETDIGDGIGIIQKSANVEYHKQLFLNDNISINIVKIEFSKSSFNIFYEIYKDDIKVINGSTLLVCFDYSIQKVKRIPSTFIEKVEQIKD